MRWTIFISISKTVVKSAYQTSIRDIQTVHSCETVSLMCLHHTSVSVSRNQNRLFRKRCFDVHALFIYVKRSNESMPISRVRRILVMLKTAHRSAICPLIRIGVTQVRLSNKLLYSCVNRCLEYCASGYHRVPILIKFYVVKFRLEIHICTYLLIHIYPTSLFLHYFSRNT